jgi:hypothetical protein
MEISVLLRQPPLSSKFSEHEIFMFVVFNILQRIKICLGAKLITSQATLRYVAKLLQNLDYAPVHEKLSHETRSSHCAFVAFVTQTNRVEKLRINTMHEPRLFKYAIPGFDVYIPAHYTVDLKLFP